MMNPKDSFKQINIVYFALLAGQLLFALVVLSMNFDRMKMDLSDRMILLAIPTMMLATYFVGNLLANSRNKAAARMEGNLSNKLMHYRVTTLLRCALVEGPNLLALVAFTLISNTYLLLIFGMGMFLFLLVKPSEEQFFRLYNIPASDQALLRKE